ncbi:hypothetical protein LguiB_009695 [Lonicera macranthoides]
MSQHHLLSQIVAPFSASAHLILEECISNYLYLSLALNYFHYPNFHFSLLQYPNFPLFSQTIVVNIYKQNTYT